jgi:hypothetical protein
MEYMIKGEGLTKVRIGSIPRHLAAKCGGNDVYCSSDSDCGKWDKCIHPTTYAGCSGGTLTFPKEDVVVRQSPVSSKGGKKAKEY